MLTDFQDTLLFYMFLFVFLLLQNNGEGGAPMLPNFLKKIQCVHTLLLGMVETMFLRNQTVFLCFYLVLAIFKLLLKRFEILNLNIYSNISKHA